MRYTSTDVAACDVMLTVSSFYANAEFKFWSKERFYNVQYIAEDVMPIS